MKKIVSLLLIAIFVASVLSSCGNGNSANDNDDDLGNSIIVGNSKPNESYFEWEDDIIIGLTASGMKQESIVIPAKCEGFDGSIFEESKAKKITFEDDDDLDISLAFLGSENLVSVELPEGLTTIPNMAFQHCTGLKNITIPSSVTTIEAYAFNFCTALETVKFEGTALKEISGHSFEDCYELKSVEIPHGVETICEYAFAECTLLSELKLSDTVGTIEKHAFKNTAIKELTLSENAQFTTIDSTAFGTSTYEMTVRIVKGSWCDLNRDMWDVGFSNIVAE